MWKLLNTFYWTKKFFHLNIFLKIFVRVTKDWKSGKVDESGGEDGLRMNILPHHKARIVVIILIQFYSIQFTYTLFIPKEN